MELSNEELALFGYDIVLLNKVNHFLTESGWGCQSDNSNIRIDPVTGEKHRFDLAFVIQTDRIIEEKLRKREQNPAGEGVI